MNMIKKNAGFTLVELIVVIAILAILAGIAIPAYSGYINSANEAADNQKLEAIETAMAAALAMHGENTDEAAKYFEVTLNEGTGVLTVAAKSYAAASVDNSEGTDSNEDGTTPTTAPANLSKVWESFGEFYGDDKTVELKYYSKATDVPDLLGCVDVTPAPNEPEDGK